jgi:NitT/TauT family transport system permease protein
MSGAEAAQGWTGLDPGETEPPSKSRRLLNWSTLVGVVSVTLGITVWAWAASQTLPLFLPSPLEVVDAAFELAQDGELQEDILISYQRVLLGWALGGAVGIPLGLLAGRSRTVAAAMAPYVNFFRFVPPIALVSLFIIWLGIGEASKVALIFYASTFLVFLNVAAGSAAVHPDKVRAAQSMGASRLRTFVMVIVPATVPAIATGLRVAMSNSFSAVVAAELVAAQTGIGSLIFTSRLLGRTDLVFVGILTLGLMGMFADLVFRRILGLIAYRYEIHV